MSWARARESSQGDKERDNFEAPGGLFASGARVSIWASSPGNHREVCSALNLS